MLSNTEIKDLYLEASDKGFVLDLSDSADCTADCDNCPAEKACVQLSEGKDYKNFVTNYNSDIVPLFGADADEEKLYNDIDFAYKSCDISLDSTVQELLNAIQTMEGYGHDGITTEDFIDRIVDVD